MSDYTIYFEKILSIFISSSKEDLIFQFIVTLILSLFTIYFIIYIVNSKNIVVFKHNRILVATVVCTLVNVLFYQMIIYINFKFDFAPFHMLVIGLITATVPLKPLQYIIAHPIMGDYTIRDMQRNDGNLFNCNWPLVPRCINYWAGNFIILLYIFNKFI